jgi:hypothetical protein
LSSQTPLLQERPAWHGLFGSLHAPPNGTPPGTLPQVSPDVIGMLQMQGSATPLNTHSRGEQVAWPVFWPVSSVATLMP